MRLDHIAYRTASRDQTVDFFVRAFGYKIQCEFEIFFNDEKTDKAMCIALEPPEKVIKDMKWFCWHYVPEEHEEALAYHLAPEIFVSEGTPGSIVGDWVAKRDGIGGVHHLAYQVADVALKMKEWTEKGLGDFSSSEPLTCEGLTQVFSKYHPLTGVIYEFIKREEFGFCKDNVKKLMESTRGD